MESAEAWHAAVRTALVAELSLVAGTWTDNGHDIEGPGMSSVLVGSRHPGGTRHVDIGFVLNREHAESPVLWDCVASPSADIASAAAFIAKVWASSVAPVALELFSRDGRFADHAQGDDGLGLAGWHSIHGPTFGYGAKSVDELQRWVLEHPPVPALAAQLRSSLTPAKIHTAKFLLVAGAESAAEVRIDGEVHQAASDALLALPWPRDGVLGALRQYTVFLHEI